MKKLLILMFIFSLTLAACSKTPAEETMEGTPISGSYPEPAQNATAPADNGYPVVEEALDISILAPQDGDANLTRGEVFLESTQLLTLESIPLQYKLMLTGSLPTPCHQLRAEVTAPDASGKIVISVYSLVAPDQMCVQVLQPFDSSLDLGSFAKGSYTVELNGVTVSQFDAP